MTNVRAAMAALAASAGLLAAAPVAGQMQGPAAAWADAEWSDEGNWFPDRRWRHKRERQGGYLGLPVFLGYPGFYGRCFNCGWGHEDFGFFSQGPSASTTMDNGMVVYDYDRSYPYDHYSYRNETAGPGDSDARRARGCRIVEAWDRTARQEVPVRVCS